MSAFLMQCTLLFGAYTVKVLRSKRLLPLEVSFPASECVCMLVNAHTNTNLYVSILFSLLNAQSGAVWFEA